MPLLTESLTVFDRWRGRAIATAPTDSQGQAIHTLVGSGVSLRNADLRGFSLAHVFLRGADFRGADLSAASLRGTYLRDASLRGATLRDADLRHASLRDCDLKNADLRGADLSAADLRGANLLGAELAGASFQNARLEGALLDWRLGTLPAEILRRASGRGDGRTRLVLDLLVHGERDDLPWLSIIARHAQAKVWAVTLLATHVRKGDNAPPLLKGIRQALSSSDELTANESLAWTRNA